MASSTFLSKKTQSNDLWEKKQYCPSPRILVARIRTVPCSNPPGILQSKKLPGKILPGPSIRRCWNNILINWLEKIGKHIPSHKHGSMEKLYYQGVYHINIFEDAWANYHQNTCFWPCHDITMVIMNAVTSSKEPPWGRKQKHTPTHPHNTS